VSGLTAPNLQPAENQERNEQCGNQYYSRELLMLGIVVPETCWAYKKYNKNNKLNLVGSYSSFIRILRCCLWQYDSSNVSYSYLIYLWRMLQPAASLIRCLKNTQICSHFSGFAAKICKFHLLVSPLDKFVTAVRSTLQFDVGIFLYDFLKHSSFTSSRLIRSETLYEDVHASLRV